MGGVNTTGKYRTGSDGGAVHEGAGLCGIDIGNCFIRSSYHLYYTLFMFKYSSLLYHTPFTLTHSSLLTHMYQHTQRGRDPRLSYSRVHRGSTYDSGTCRGGGCKCDCRVWVYPPPR